MFKIQGPQSLNVVEKELSQLVRTPMDELQIPVNPQKWWMGGELALVQLVVTWVRMCERATLVTHISPNEDPANQLKSMAGRIFGFVTLLLAERILDRSLNEDRSLKPIAYELCSNVVARMYGPIDRFAMGAKVYLISVDHSRKWAIPWLYNSAGQVHDRTQFISLVQKLVRKVGPNLVDDPIPEILFPKFGAILHELFKNTDEWAKTNVDKTPFRRSTRGLSVERHRFHRDQLPFPIGQGAYGTFFGQCESYDDYYRFLEFTVFDSGVGLARRWLNMTDLSQLELKIEMNAVTECLEKNNTSSHRPEKGIGLAEVYSTLHEIGAFLYLRTGRLSLFRDFRSNPREDSSDVRIFDLPSCTEIPTEHAPTWGTCFQILIPLTEK